MTGLLISDDLIFSSRITGTARAHGGTMRVVRSADQAMTLWPEVNPTCLIVDLQNPGLVIEPLMSFVRSQGGPAVRVVAYGSHVAADVLKAARTAGCDLVLPRSKFVADLETNLPAWLASPVPSV